MSTSRATALDRLPPRSPVRYRNGVLHGRGASLLDGYMEDLATDRIYRLMIAQRIRHHDTVLIADSGGRPVPHTEEFVGRLFDEEPARLLDSPVPGRDVGGPESMREARRVGEELIRNRWFDPV